MKWLSTALLSVVVAPPPTLLLLLPAAAELFGFIFKKIPTKPLLRFIRSTERKGGERQTRAAPCLPAPPHPLYLHTRPLPLPSHPVHAVFFPGASSGSARDAGGGFVGYVL